MAADSPAALAMATAEAGVRAIAANFVADAGMDRPGEVIMAGATFTETMAMTEAATSTAAVSTEAADSTAEVVDSKPDLGN